MSDDSNVKSDNSNALSLLASCVDMGTLVDDGCESGPVVWASQEEYEAVSRSWDSIVGIERCDGVVAKGPKLKLTT